MAVPKIPSGLAGSLQNTPIYGQQLPWINPPSGHTMIASYGTSAPSPFRHSAGSSIHELFVGLYSYLLRCEDVPPELFVTLEEVVLGKALSPLERAAKQAAFFAAKRARVAVVE